MMKWFDKFYEDWVHPEIRLNVTENHISRQVMVSDLIGFGTYGSLIIAFYYFNYPYGIIACIIGIVSNIISIFLLKYSSNLRLTYYSALLVYILIVFTLGYGVGGLLSLFSLAYVFYIWAAFYYDLKLGIIWTAILILWVVGWGLAEINGFEYPISFTDFGQKTFTLLFILYAFGLFSITFWTAKVNQGKLLNDLKKSEQRLVKNEKLITLGQFTAGIAHEINNPINFIGANATALKLDFGEVRNLLELIDEVSSDPSNTKSLKKLIKLSKQFDSKMLKNEMADLIEGIDKGSKRIAEIVEGLKNYTHESTASWRHEDINDIIKFALTLLNRKIHEKDIQVIKHLETIPKIYCHGGQISQVLINIIDNAIQAIKIETKKTQGIITISSKVLNGMINIKIEDDGIGMDSETLDRVFDPFYTKKKIGEGTGLGMYITQGIVKDHNGIITVTSDQNSGTTVSITLPLK